MIKEEDENSSTPKRKSGKKSPKKTPKVPKAYAEEVQRELVENATTFITYSGFNRSDEDVEFNRTILKRFKLADMEDATNQNVRVVVVKDKKRTLKVLQAIARGISIVDERWLNDSIEKGKLLNADKYHVDWFPGAQKSRVINTEKDPRIFEEKRIYLGKTKMPKNQLEWLIMECGGTLCKTEDEGDFKGCSEKWVLDAIEKQELPDPIY